MEVLWITVSYLLQHVHHVALVKFSFVFVQLVHCLCVCGNLRTGIPLRGTHMSCFGRVDITQRGAIRVVSVLCHVRKFGPRGGFGQSPLRENKTVVLRVIIYDCTRRERLTAPVSSIAR